MLRTLLAALAVLCAIPLAGLQPGGPPWWKHAVFYEIYPRSFQDSNGDGVGDLAGILSRLDYLQELGIDAVWLTPCFPSPQVDFGYDVSNFRDIDPVYGTLQDFDRLVAEGRKRGIRVVLDLVLNHTSDRHPWFRESRASRTNPRRDWFIWRDGKGQGAPPSNWLSLFGGSAWTLDPATGQSYYHYFYREQPDLNWRNPEVAKEMLDVTRWWYQRGAAGFRLDAVDTMFEDPQLRDNPVLPGLNPFGDPNMRNLRNYRLPEVHGVLKDLRSAADAYGAVLIGETYTETAAELRTYYGDGRNELQLPTGHMLALAPVLSAAEFRKRIGETESTGFWPVLVLDNHDLARSVTRYGDGVHDDAIARILGTLLLTLRGTPILYYGEELGMVNNDPARPEDVRDALGRSGWPAAKLRDGARTPMPWQPGPGAGFTRGEPWLPVGSQATTHNVETETGDPDSVLAHHRALLALRRSSRPLLDGDYLPLGLEDPNVLSYLRVAGNEAVLVALNLTGRPQPTAFHLAEMGWPAAGAKVLLSSGQGARGTGVPERLEPFAVVVMALSR
jgi:alpha-glucosidase